MNYKLLVAFAILFLAVDTIQGGLVQHRKADKPRKIVDFEDENIRSKLPMLERVNEEELQSAMDALNEESMTSAPSHEFGKRDVEGWSSSPSPVKKFTSSRVVSGHEKAYPFKTAVKLFFKDASGANFVCSGVVVNTNLVLTAGHCVYSSSGWHNYFTIVPAYKNGTAPFGQWYASHIWSHSAWLANATIPNKGDFGLLQAVNLQSGGPSIGSKVGTRPVKSNFLSNQHVTVLGYPANLDGGKIMHRCDAMTVAPPATTPNYQRNREIGSDMAGGASGGPWYLDFGTQSNGQKNAFNYYWSTVVGITSYGASQYNKYAFLGSSIIDNQVVTKINSGKLN